MQNTISKIYENKEFIEIIKDIIDNETVQEMRNFNQHCETSCFDHCLCVAYYSYLICKKFNLDYRAVARSGMLHDLFLYDWRERVDGRKGLHAFTHPKTALENSLKLFSLTEKEQDIILKHMWPVTFVPPKYMESYIITFVDKHCALKESLTHFRNLCFSKKAFKYAYIFLSLLILKF